MADANQARCNLKVKKTAEMIFKVTENGDKNFYFIFCLFIK
jgi:hypothetical protein